MLLVQAIIISVTYVYAPQYTLGDSLKNNFYDSFINAVTKLGKKETVVIAGDFNGHVGSNAGNYEEQHGDFIYWVRIKEGERVLEFYEAMNMTVENRLICCHLICYG